MVEESDDRGLSRRAFLKRMAALAFAVPVISSFALDAASASGGAPHSAFSNQPPVTPEEFFGNQVYELQRFPNPAFPYEYGPSQFPNQYVGNQA